MGLVFAELHKHPDVYTNPPYSMSPRTTNDKKRHAKLLQYAGPDPATVQLLRANLDAWEQSPATFWTHAEPTVAHDPLAGLAMCYRRVQQIGP
jgi:hypothetical protein